MDGAVVALGYAKVSGIAARIPQVDPGAADRRQLEVYADGRPGNSRFASILDALAERRLSGTLRPHDGDFDDISARGSAGLHSGAHDDGPR